MRDHKAKYGEIKYSTMDEVVVFKSSPALVDFLNFAGHASRNLSVLAVAIETLKANEPIIPSDLAIQANVPSNDEQWNEARDFAITASFVLVYDAVDRYLRTLSKIHNLLPADVVDVVNTQKTMKGDSKYSLVERFKAIAKVEEVNVLPEYLAMSELFSAWRNKMVHRSHSTDIQQTHKDLLLRRSDFFNDNHGGADIREIISQFERGEKPELLQVSTMFSSIYKLIRSIDYAVIDRVEPKVYLHSLVKFLIQSSENPKERLDTLWEFGDKRAAGRVQSCLLEMGVCTRGYVRESAPKISKAIYFTTIPNGRNEARSLFL